MISYCDMIVYQKQKKLKKIKKFFIFSLTNPKRYVILILSKDEKTKSLLRKRDEIMSKVIKKKDLVLKLKSKRINPCKENVDFTTFVGIDEYLIDDIKLFLEKGDYAIVLNTRQVEKILSCFDNPQEFEINRLSNGCYGILPPLTTTYVKHQYESLLQE